MIAFVTAFELASFTSALTLYWDAPTAAISEVKSLVFAALIERLSALILRFSPSTCALIWFVVSARAITV